MKQVKQPLLVHLVFEILLGIIIVEPIVKFNACTHHFYIDAL